MLRAAGARGHVSVATRNPRHTDALCWLRVRTSDASHSHDESLFSANFSRACSVGDVCALLCPQCPMHVCAQSACKPRSENWDQTDTFSRISVINSTSPAGRCAPQCRGGHAVYALLHSGPLVPSVRRGLPDTQHARLRPGMSPTSPQAVLRKLPQSGRRTQMRRLPAHCRQG